MKKSLGITKLQIKGKTESQTLKDTYYPFPKSFNDYRSCRLRLFSLFKKLIYSIPSTGNIEKLTYMLIQYPLLEILKNLPICWFNTLYWQYWKTYIYVDSIPCTGNIEKLTYMLIQYPLLEMPLLQHGR